MNRSQALQKGHCLRVLSPRGRLNNRSKSDDADTISASFLKIKKNRNDVQSSVNGYSSIIRSK